MEAKKLQGDVADVDIEEARKEIGLALEGRERSGAEGWGAIHQEHGAGHEVGETLDAAVVALVGGEVVGAERAGEGAGLTEGEGEAFAGEGVD